MCAVIGVSSRTPKLKTVYRLFLESKIRGMHATGVSWVKNNKVHTIHDPIPADKFLEVTNFSKFINEDGGLYLIGHCRYSTSDLYFNQPISDKNQDLAIVHNGVISQDPTNWEFQTEGKNDSELIFQARKVGKDPLEMYNDRSLAVIELDSLKRFRYYRNGKRPLWTATDLDSFYIASTKDILNRSGLFDTQEIMTDYIDWQHI